MLASERHLFMNRVALAEDSGLRLYRDNSCSDVEQ
jgi:hypothetical protein